MFDYSFPAQLKKVDVKAIEDGPEVRRRCRMALERTFDAEIATGLGEGARQALKALKEHTYAKVEIPLDSVLVKATLKGPASSVDVSECKGIKATATAAKEPEDEDADQEEPRIKLEFEFPYTQAVWIFLGENAGAYAEITLEKMQLPLDYGNDNAREKKKQLTIGGHKANGGPTPPAEVGKAPKESKRGRRVAKENADRDEAQDAETPEEAEQLREERRAREAEEKRVVTVQGPNGETIPPEDGEGESLLTVPEAPRCPMCHGLAAGPHATWCSQYAAPAGDGQGAS